MAAGYDPSALRAIAHPGGTPPGPAAPLAPPHGAAPGQAPPPAAAPQKSEPAQLAEHANAACEAITAAKSALEDLSAIAEMSETIDPAVEKAIAKSLDSITKIEEDMNGAHEGLTEAADDHEAAVNGDDKPAKK